MDATSIIWALIIVGGLVYIFWLHPKKVSKETEQIAQQKAEQATVNLMTIEPEPAAEVPTVMTLEELIAEGMSPAEARAELRAQRRELREHQLVEKRLAAEDRRVERERIAEGRALRREQRERARTINQNVRTGISVAKSLGKLLK